MAERLSITSVLRILRGETSEPLRQELSRIVEACRRKFMPVLAVQIDSEIATSGLSLLIDFENRLLQIYLARGDIPGYLPGKATSLLLESGWSVYNDHYGEELALVWKKYGDFAESQIIEQVVFALEALGAPRRKVWSLEPMYLHLDRTEN